MKVLGLIFIFVFIVSTKMGAQQQFTPLNYLGIGIGYSLDNIKDTNLSPLNQNGSSLFYSIFYERRARNILKINIKYSDGILKSGRSNKLETSYYKANVGVTYLKNISGVGSQSTNFYLGGDYGLDILYLDWYGQDAFSYVAKNGLSLSAAVSQQLTSKQYVESTVSIPVVQFLSRPPYNGLDEYIIENQDEPLNILFNGKLSSIKEYKAINWNVNYVYKISNHFNWKVDYDFNIQKVEETPLFKSLSNKISTSILYQF